ncbi:MAG: excinuclease ABC subunit UvrC [Bdellovibrionales bacterium]|nr:excinuclease ABC subunit UvrC [Bdellovibrionales bacterium]
MRVQLLESAHAAPTDPGVYLMRDASGAILYIGKAKNLKNRLVTYFQGARSGAAHEIPRIEIMVSRVEKFDVILTETESEALILECTLIKKHKPKFNIRLKDDKAYPYLRIQVGDEFPRIEWTRRVRRDGARYFGPFPSGYSAKSIMRLLIEMFKLRDCSDNTFRHRSRPCILYQMQKCTGPCVGLISKEAYRESIESAIRILEGKSDLLRTELERGMRDAAEHEEYEDAAFYRDSLENLSVVTATQSVDEAGAERNRDVIAVERGAGAGHAVVLQIRGGKMVAVRHLNLQNSDDAMTDSEVLFDFLAQYYVQLEADVKAAEKAAETDDGILSPGLVFAAREALLPVAPDDPELLERALGVKIRVPETDVERQLVNVAKTNARHALEQAKKNETGHGLAALEEIQDKLHLPKLPTRIECYDNSNIQGEDAVASRVVFIDGAPNKNLYRRYKIRTVEGANDFATMREVLGRRFSGSARGENGEIEDLPDLVVVDGGKGQLSQAVVILEELSVQGVAVVGLAKARTESDFRKKEVESTLERIFIPGRKNPVPLHPHTQAYKLLVHVRDEAHRFAITYHRLLRDKRSLKSGD